MAVDYDLVILGGTQVGYEAACHAAQLGARTALVLQGLEGRRSPLKTLGALWTTRSPFLVSPSENAAATWQWAIQRATLIADKLTSNDFQQLMMQGVDVIAESGQLVRDRPLQVTTPSRQLSSRSLLLATGSRPCLPTIPGLEAVSYETPETFLHRETLPQSVAILGSAPTALTLCQTLCRWGVTTILITPTDALLSREDPDVARWITGQLRAEGAQLRLGQTVQKITANDTMLALCLADETIQVEALVVATKTRPNLMGTNLETFLDGDRGFTVNAYLQTQNPRIYACGAVLGGYEMPAIARQEALIAVENALFWHRRRIDYGTLPYDLPTEPAMARVGLTEPQARRRYSETDLYICRQSLYDNPKAQWLESTTGFCKLMAHRKGQILGAHGVGPDANEWVQTMAWLMSQKTPWTAIANHPTLPHSLNDILRQTAQQWERDRWQPGQWRRDWAENWFNWRRSR